MGLFNKPAGLPPQCRAPWEESDNLYSGGLSGIDVVFIDITHKFLVVTFGYIQAFDHLLKIIATLRVKFLYQAMGSGI